MRIEGVLNYYDAWPPVLQDKQWSVEYSNYYPSLSGTVSYNSLPANPGELFRTEVRVIGSNVNANLGVVVGLPYSIAAPTIHVEYLSDDPNNPYGPLIVTPTSFPTVTFTETHTPMPGDDQKVGEEWNPGSEPVITWNRPQIVSSAEFYDPITNEFVIPQEAETYIRFTGLDEIEVSLEAKAINQYGEAVGGQSVRFQRVTPLTPVDHFQITTIPNEIEYGDTATIFVQAKDAEGNDVDFPYSQQLTIMAESAEYGHFEVQEVIVGRSLDGIVREQKGSSRLMRKHRRSITTGITVAQDSLFTFTYFNSLVGGLRYIADGKYPIIENNIRLKIAIPSNVNIAGRDSLKIQPNCSIVDVTPSEINPGDTAVVNVFMKKRDGTIQPFPKGTIFSIGILPGGEAFGHLEYNSEKANSFDSVFSLPIQFVADTVLTAPSVSLMLTGHPSGSTDQSVMRKQESKSTMSSGKNGKKYLQKTAEDMCDAGKAVVIEKVELIVIEKPVQDLLITNNEPPLMPENEVIKAQLKNFKRGGVTIQASLSVFWKRRGTEKGKVTSGIYPFPAVSVNNSEVALIHLDWPEVNEQIRGGDSVIVILEAETESGHYFKNIMVKPFAIKGTNPDKTTIRNKLASIAGSEMMGSYSLAHILQAICHHESGGTYQFKQDGLPVFGDPKGYGLMMPDPAADEMVWNWIENIKGGMIRYREKERFAKQYNTYLKTGNIDRFGKVMHPMTGPQKREHWYEIVVDEEKKLYKTGSYNNVPPLEGEQLLLDMLQSYNGGAYCQWVPLDKKDPDSGGIWKANPTKDENKNIYADIVFNILQKIANGQTNQIPHWN